MALDRAILGFQGVLGDAGCRCDDATLSRYARGTGPWESRPCAVLLPASAEQVQAIVLVAATEGVPLYPISRGRNWGYGDANAAVPGCAVVDLQRMNRIIEVSDRLAYCVIEPGVTQQQLSEHLAAKHPNLWMDVTGAGLQASVVGNTLDRGFGHTRLGDHVATACGMDIVLADGSLLRTGMGIGPDAPARRVYRYGVGPSLDGLFCQSNLGIVTRLGLWLMPKPQDFLAFFFAASEHGDLAGLVDRLAPLRLQGLLQSTVHIANDLRAMSARMRYPFDLAGGKTPMPDGLRAQLRKKLGLGAWNGAGAIYGSPGMVRDIQREVARALRGHRVRFLSDRRLAFAKGVVRRLSPLGLGGGLAELLGIVEPLFGLLQGRPSDEPLRGASWRVRGPVPATPMDPLDTHAGLLWSAPVIQMLGSAATELMALVDPIHARHGFENLTTFTMINERAMIAVSNVAYDRREADESARALRCYEELLETMVAKDLLPYRASPLAYAKLRGGGSTHWRVAGAIKRALDPKGIMSPGRYVE